MNTIKPRIFPLRTPDVSEPENPETGRLEKPAPSQPFVDDLFERNPICRLPAFDPRMLPMPPKQPGDVDAQTKRLPEEGLDAGFRPPFPPTRRRKPPVNVFPPAQPKPELPPPSKPVPGYPPPNATTMAMGEEGQDDGGVRLPPAPSRRRPPHLPRPGIPRNPPPALQPSPVPQPGVPLPWVPAPPPPAAPTPPPTGGGPPPNTLPQPPAIDSPGLPPAPPPAAGDQARSLVEGGAVSLALAKAGVKTPEEAQRVLDYGAKVLGKNEEQVANLLRRSAADPRAHALLNGLVSGAEKSARGMGAEALADVADGLKGSLDALPRSEVGALTKSLIAEAKGPGLERFQAALSGMVDHSLETAEGALTLLGGALRGDANAIKDGLESMELSVRKGPKDQRTEGFRRFNMTRDAMLAALPLEERTRIFRETAENVPVASTSPDAFQYLGRRPRDASDFARAQDFPSLTGLFTHVNSNTHVIGAHFPDLNNQPLADGFASLFGGGG